MTERTVTVTNQAGIHTRPASIIVRTASNFEAEIIIQRGAYEINGKSVIGVMTLAAEQGVELTLRADGPDESEALAALADLFARGFGETAPDESSANDDS
ncbi:phosphocarrier protein HPr [Longimonas halophila]|uniref:Phosphocarrier protein HPr n=1 Tax=Longimonas halophila TaxID=1469170 RepID=A0A2H3NSX3_9BACT|nr:HPr family phosphocarrier protein [Longimonas halophila]PEN09326.1 phosphocarrier protein HPr [Longimonas halophila]